VVISDEQRDAIAAGLLAALLLIYRGRVMAIYAALKLDLAVTVSAAAQSSLATFAVQRARLIQVGINDRVSAALDALPDDADQQATDAALAAVRQSVETHHTDKLLPVLISAAWHQATVDTYQNTESSQPDKSLADVTPWTWTQYTEFEDDCQDAAAASPASLDDLLAIAGDKPPLHVGCGCTLDPGDTDPADLPT
jgi:hypothetical protein